MHLTVMMVELVIDEIRHGRIFSMMGMEMMVVDEAIDGIVMFRIEIEDEVGVLQIVKEGIRVRLRSPCFGPVVD